MEIGAYSVIEGPVQIGPGTRIGTHVFITGWTTIGRDCEIHHGAALGDTPQDFHFSGERSYLRIGDRVVLREYCTVHRGTQPESATILEDEVVVLATGHVGHNVIMRRGSKLYGASVIAGHAEIGAGAIISGTCAVHQFVRIGELAMIGGGTRVPMDVPPFMLAVGNGKVAGVNVIGLRRAGVAREAVEEIRRIHGVLYRRRGRFREAIEEAARLATTPEAQRLIAFLREPSRRGIAGPLEERLGSSGVLAKGEG